MALHNSKIKILLAALFYLSVPCSYSVPKAGAEVDAVMQDRIEEAKRAVRIKDYKKAAELFRVLAQQGNADSQYQLGVLYQAGKGVDKDYAKALSLFHQAAVQGHAKALYSLGEMYEFGLGLRPDLKTALSWYSRSANQGYSQALVKVKKLNEEVLSSRNDHEFLKGGALLAASRRGNIAELEQLLKSGADINFRNDSGRTCLMEAVDYGQDEAAKFLLQKGADPAIYSNDGDNAFLVAVQKKDQAMAEALSKAGVDINAANKQGITPLMLAVKNSDVPLVKFLINKKADVKKVDLEGRNALQMAVLKGSNEIIKILLATGQVNLSLAQKSPEVLKTVVASLETDKDINITKSFESGTPLMLAAWRGEADIVRMLIAGKKDVNVRDRQGQTALSLAAWRGNVDIVDMLIKAGADIGQDVDNGVSALVLAARNGHTAVVRRLVKEYKMSGLSDKILNKALDEAIKNGHGASARALLETGLNWGINKAQATVSLLAAASRGDAGLVEILLEHGADINAVDQTGRTSLMIATESGNEESLKSLLGRHADINKKDNEGHTALSLAARSGKIGIVTLLINAGSDIRVKSVYGNTPLMLAVDSDDVYVVQELIRHKAEVGAKNNSGETALAIAVKKKNVAVAKILLENGASPYLPLRLTENTSKQIRFELNRYKSLKKWLMILIGLRLKSLDLVVPGRGIGLALGILGVVSLILLFIYSLRKRMSQLEVIGSTKAWFRIHMIFGVLAPVFVLFHANFRLGALNSNVALLTMIIVSISGIIGRFIYGRIHYGLYGELANMAELKNKFVQQKEEAGEEFALLPAVKEELFAFADELLYPETAFIGSIKRFIIIKWRSHIAVGKIKRLSGEYVCTRAIENKWGFFMRRRMQKQLQKKAKGFLAQASKVAGFNVYERLFSYWHMLHIPLVFILVLAVILHVAAANRF